MKNQHLIDALNKLPDNWTPLPVDRNKRPLVDDWQKGFSRETVIEILTNGYHGINKEGKPYFNPASTYTGFGFLTGELSGGIVAIDCDGVAAHELAERLGGLPKTVSFTSGKEGRAQYLYKMPPEFWGAIQTKKLNTGVKENNKDVLLELRWDGCQSVLPPSQHPETDGYKWINDPSTPIAECPNWIIEQMLIVPKVTASTPPELPLLSYPEKNNNYRDEPIPLLNCLSKDHRSLIESGAGEGGRNDGGAKVARDLIGTESRLQYLGFEFTGRARDLFDDYCDRCNPRINDKERETIWDSATKSHPTPCLSDDKLENCYKAWNRKSSTYTTSRTFNTGNKPDNSVSISDRNLNPKRKKATKNEIYAALEQVKEILLDASLDEIDKEIEIEQLKEDLAIDWKLWGILRSKVNKAIRGNQLESELKSLLLIDDKIKLHQGIHDLSEKYRMSLGSLIALLKELKARNITPQFEAMGLDDLFDEVSDAIDYLIPGLLPRGESAILAASPKVGKSLLAIDLAFAVATGEDYFLGETCQQGKVLLVSVDESKQSVKAKLTKRGFRKHDAPNIRLITQFCVSQLEKLEAEIEYFRPTLVIIDSLKRITKGSEISENSAEFSDNIYTISELCNRYGASCVLIHHSKKDNEIIGVDNVRGSSAITGAFGNTWIMNRVATPDPENKKKAIFDPKDPRRQLYCFSRDSEGKAFNLEFNPENNGWVVTGEMGVSEEDAQQQKTAKERILSVLRANLPHYPDGVSSGFIFDCLELGGESMPKGTLWSSLNRLVSDRIIGMAPSRTARHSLYFLPGYGYGQSETNQNTTNQPDSKTKTSEYENVKKTHIPPHPPLYLSENELNTTTIMDVDFQELSSSFHSTFIPLSSKSENTTHVSDCTVDVEAVSGATYTELSFFPDQGGGGCAFNFEPKIEAANSDTTKPGDTTFLGTRSIDPNPWDDNKNVETEPEPIDPDKVNIGDILFDKAGNPHQITKFDIRNNMWKTHRKEGYISRNELMNTDEFHRATVEDIAGLMPKIIAAKNKVQAKWLCDIYGGDSTSLMALAFITNPEGFCEIYEFDSWD